MLYEQISEDIKTAMKNKEKDKLDALRYLKSMLLENKTSNAPKAELDVVVTLSKKLKDSMETYPEGHEARVKIQKEIEFISAYMPQPVTEDEVKKIISDIIQKLGTPNPHLGAVMKELTPQIKGRFDGKRANELVKDALGTP